MLELLLWAVLFAYGCAAVAYALDARHPGRHGAFATWGVRLGWLAQSALLAVQVEGARGFPWDSWAASLNLFVWLVVSVYLAWGCRPRYRVLGLVVMPAAVTLLGVSFAAGGAAAEPSLSGYSNAFLLLHVGLVLGAFAGFTLAAGLATVYLWQERRLKRRDATVLRPAAPSLLGLDQLVGRVLIVAVPALTGGIAIGLARLGSDGGRFDAVMAVTLLAWAAYTGLLLVRYRLGWRGRRLAYGVLLGFALVATVRLGLPLTHFS